MPKMKMPEVLENEYMDVVGPQAGRGHVVRLELSPRKVRAVLNGVAVADSRKVALLHETGHLPVYYFPKDDVRMDLLTRTEHSSHCPFKGDASYWSIEVAGKVAENAVWGYESPIDDASELSNYVAFYWNKLDSWFEEDDEVFVHARDPYSRIDVLHSSRHVRVVISGETVADTIRPRLLFETGLPTRYYIPRADVRMDLLKPTDSSSRCPYKGIASYIIRSRFRANSTKTSRGPTTRRFRSVPRSKASSASSTRGWTSYGSTTSVRSVPTRTGGDSWSGTPTDGA